MDWKLFGVWKLLRNWKFWNRIYLPDVRVDSGDAQNNVCESSSDTFDLTDAISDFPLSVNIGVEKTDNVSKICRFL